MRNYNEGSKRELLEYRIFGFPYKSLRCKERWTTIPGGGPELQALHITTVKGMLESKTNCEPPPYTAPIIAEETITGTSTPKYEWDNAQCRTWTQAVLTERCGRNTEYANTKAHQFEGCGPNLWLRERKKWIATSRDDGVALSHFLRRHYR